MTDLTELSDRARTVFAQVVEQYVTTGMPVGSKTLAARPDALRLSPASIRSVLKDLESAGLLAAPHTSAGRMPTDAGLRLFVDGMIEWRKPDEAERAAIEQQTRAATSEGLSSALEKTTGALADLASCAALVMMPRGDARLRQVAFTRLSDRRALMVLIGADGSVENRIVESEEALSDAALAEATNYANERLSGLTLKEGVERLEQEIRSGRAALQKAASGLVETGLAVWSRDESNRAVLIVRGQAHLLDPSNADDLDRVRQLLEDIDEKEQLLSVLDLAREAKSMRIFIGAENPLYSLSGSSMIAAPYASDGGSILGVVGVIGPTRLNYARIIPMVDYTAKTLSRLIE
ncbi:heat-inducible transcriptional repressor HrcA [Pacificimonas flava]|uniref:Heat-inducible transcription repressor HrcA n=2 Tax=Pacificimonas TaxID=1960290 RepID=A0A219B0M0_9SPHN|nr:MULTISPECIES: heat-inducible transcriptional repressor HrcA [Pacificimonas]MBZ6379659.1 heat-inducible transcriptional repressor HrcA [Pacificimonas aurantium]OWV31877.1 heat-inducible transcriptional repressor HrcA [Pacificimonas flava]